MPEARSTVNHQRPVPRTLVQDLGHGQPHSGLLQPRVAAMSARLDEPAALLGLLPCYRAIAHDRRGPGAGPVTWRCQRTWTPSGDCGLSRPHSARNACCRHSTGVGEVTRDQSAATATRPRKAGLVDSVSAADLRERVKSGGLPSETGRSNIAPACRPSTHASGPVIHSSPRIRLSATLSSRLSRQAPSVSKRQSGTCSGFVCRSMSSSTHIRGIRPSPETTQTEEPA